MYATLNENIAVGLITTKRIKFLLIEPGQIYTNFHLTPI